MFVSLFIPHLTKPNFPFPIFCLNNQTALHGCCIQGSKVPFKDLLNQYENKRIMRENLYGKSKRLIPQYMDAPNLRNFKRISYPVEFQQYQKKLELFLSADY